MHLVADRARSLPDPVEEMMPESRPLPTLLSQVLIAFTIEFDNAFEERVPHRITAVKAPGARPGPWLVSLAMWSTFMRFIDDDGISVRAFAIRSWLRAPDLRFWLPRMSKWGYVVVSPGSNAADRILRPTDGGRRAREVWAPLSAEIEARWKARFGGKVIGALEDDLRDVAAGLDAPLRATLPILGFGLSATDANNDARPRSERERLALAALDFRELLTTVLLAFTAEFERASTLSLAICAGVLRVITEAGVLSRDLPRLTGVAKPALDMAVGYLERNGWVTSGTTPPSRSTKVTVTPEGLAAQREYERLLAEIEARWATRCGADTITRLRSGLSALLDARDETGSLLGQGLVPPLAGWRNLKPFLAQTQAMIRDPAAALPHFPMTLHRGAWPDGA
jgi:DNA-binding MarR family transcriptional regulator